VNKRCLETSTTGKKKDVTNGKENGGGTPIIFWEGGGWGGGGFGWVSQKIQTKKKKKGEGNGKKKKKKPKKESGANENLRVVGRGSSRNPDICVRSSSKTYSKSHPGTRIAVVRWEKTGGGR